jgi:hypothetical protein
MGPRCPCRRRDAAVAHATNTGNWSYATSTAAARAARCARLSVAGRPEGSCGVGLTPRYCQGWSRWHPCTARLGCTGPYQSPRGYCWPGLYQPALTRNPPARGMEIPLPSGCSEPVATMCAAPEWGKARRSRVSYHLARAGPSQASGRTRRPLGPRATGQNR